MSVERLKQLRLLIEHHNKLYYLQDSPEISDAEYDKFFRELLELEAQYPEMYSPDSPALKVGTAPLSELKTHHHRYRMYSLANAMTVQEFNHFFSTIMNMNFTSLATPSVVLEYKFDGLALELVYKDGVLCEASTRGDGEIGELVTENVRTIKNVPLRLEGNAPSDLVVYGEAVMLKESFHQLNAKRKENGEKEFANPRNAASGSIRLLDSRQSYERNLLFYVYDCRTEDSMSDISHMNLHTHRMDALKQLGFWTSPERKIIHPGSLHEAYEFYNSVLEKRSKLPFEIDGLVAKTVMDEIRDVLGYTDRAPRWAIAWKFAAEEAETELLGIDYEVGRTGALTPVAILKPIELAGVTISRAALHNFDYIIENDFRIGDTVVIKRAGDVIPFVVKSVLSLRPEHTQPVSEPIECPSCKTPPERSKTNMDEDSRIIRCPNSACPGRIRSRLKYFVSKQGLDIEGFGDRVVDILFDQGLLGSSEKEYTDCFADIFKLNHNKEKILNLEGFGEKSVLTLIKQIEMKKNPTLACFIQAFGIRSIGNVAANKLAKCFTNFESLTQAYQSNGVEFELLSELQSNRKNVQQLLLQRQPIEEQDIPLREAIKNVDNLIMQAKKDSDNPEVLQQRLAEKRVLFDQRAILKPMKKEFDEKIAKLRAEEVQIIQKLILGVNSTEELVLFFAEKRSQMELLQLLESDFSIKETQNTYKTVLGNTPFLGKKILITGKSDHLSTRQEMMSFLESIGAQPMAGVTRSVDFVVECEKPGSEKIKKALDLEIPILKESEFFSQMDPDILNRFRSLFLLS